MEKIKGMTTCKVCGRDFPLMHEEHHIVRDTEISGVVAAFSSHEAPMYDAFDCPHCGCQNVMQSRKREYCPCDYDICDECEDDLK